MKKERQQTYETYNHRILWSATEKNLQLATSAIPDAKYFALGAMMLSFFAFEGYLNWLGARIAPEVWDEERQFFSRSPCQGTLGKYRFLAKLLRLPRPDDSKGPFQTAKELKKLRDAVAHPKLEAGERSVKFSEGHFPQLYQSELDNRVSPELASRAISDLETLAEGLHCEAKRAYPDDVHETRAFGSLLGMEITDA